MKKNLFVVYLLSLFIVVTGCQTDNQSDQVETANQEAPWTVYENQELGFKISYPENLTTNFKEDTGAGYVQIMADGVPVKPADYYPGWNKDFTSEQYEQMQLASIGISVSVLENKTGRETIDFFTAFVNGEIGWDDESLQEPCLMGDSYDESWLTKNQFDLNGRKAVRRQLFVCPPGGGGADIVFVATPDKLYKIKMNMSASNGELDDGYWRDLFKRIFYTFEVL